MILNIQPSRAALLDGAKYDVEASIAHEAKEASNDFQSPKMSPKDSQNSSKTVENEQRCAMRIENSHGLRKIIP